MTTQCSDTAWTSPGRGWRPPASILYPTYDSWHQEGTFLHLQPETSFLHFTKVLTSSVCKRASSVGLVRKMWWVYIYIWQLPAEHSPLLSEVSLEWKRWQNGDSCIWTTPCGYWSTRTALNCPQLFIPLSQASPRLKVWQRGFQFLDWVPVQFWNGVHGLSEISTYVNMLAQPRCELHWLHCALLDQMGQFLLNIDQTWQFHLNHLLV